jgi:type I restriction enzyme S subunit
MANKSSPSTNGMRTVRLGEIFRERRESGVPGLPTMSVTMGSGIVDRESMDRRVLSELRPDQHLLARKGDIAYNMMRMWQGVSGLVPYDCLVSPAYVVLEPIRGINSEYAAYLFKSESTIRKLHRFSQGLTGDRLRLYFDQLKTIPVDIPSVETQDFIAVVLKAIDTAIEATHAVVEQTRQLKTALLQDLMVKGLPGKHTKFVYHNVFGTIPAAWNTSSIGSLCYSAIDGPFGSNLKTEHYSDSGARVLRLQNIGIGEFLNDDKVFVSVEHFNTLGRFVVAPGDLILASMGDDKWPAGRCCEVPQDISPAIIKADCFRLRVNDAKSTPGFLKWYLNSPLAQRAIVRGSHGQTRTRLNLANAKRIAVPIPSNEEQLQIGEMIQAVHDRSHDELGVIDHLTSFKTALSQGLLSGRIPVSVRSAALATNQGTDARKKRKD